MILYLKLGGAAVLLALVVGLSYHFGGLSAHNEMNAESAARLTLVVKTYEAQIKALTDRNAAQQKVMDRYDATKDIPDPNGVGLAVRVLTLACPTPIGGIVPPTAGGGGGVTSARGEPGGAGEVEPGRESILSRDLDDYIQACGRDAKRLTTLQAL